MKILTDVSFFNATFSCGNSVSCPPGGCLRGGREYFLEASLATPGSTLPPGSTVAFFVNGVQIGNPVIPTQTYIDSDSSFIARPYMPAPGEQIILSAVLRRPHLPDEKLDVPHAIIFDPLAVFKGGSWHVHIDQVRTLFQRSCDFCSSNSDPNSGCQLFYLFDTTASADGQFSYDGCTLVGTLTITASGTVNRHFYTKYNEPAGSEQCTQGTITADHIGPFLDIGKTKVTLGGGPAVVLDPPCTIQCPFGGLFSTIPSTVYFPVGFTYDSTIVGPQMIADYVVTVSYGNTPRIEYHRQWNHQGFLDANRDVGESHVVLERTDTTPPAP
jgi:hypothetical protein